MTSYASFRSPWRSGGQNPCRRTDPLCLVSSDLAHLVSGVSSNYRQRPGYSPLFFPPNLPSRPTKCSQEHIVSPLRTVISKISRGFRELVIGSSFIVELGFLERVLRIRQSTAEFQRGQPFAHIPLSKLRPYPNASGASTSRSDDLRLSMTPEVGTNHGELGVSFTKFLPRATNNLVG